MTSEAAQMILAFEPCANRRYRVNAEAKKALRDPTTVDDELTGRWWLQTRCAIILMDDRSVHDCDNNVLL